MSDLYETPENRKRQAEIVAQLPLLLGGGCEFFMTPPTYAIDACLTVKGIVETVVEVKIRTCEVDQFNDYMIDLTKVASVLRLAEIAHANPLLVVYWEPSRCFGLCNLRESSWVVKLGRRDDRKDENDVEPCCYIPIRKSFEIFAYRASWLAGRASPSVAPAESEASSAAGPAPSPVVIGVTHGPHRITKTAPF